jgi:hypothetical protein
MKLITKAELVANARKAYDERHLTAQQEREHARCVYSLRINDRDCYCVIGAPLPPKMRRSATRPHLGAGHLSATNQPTLDTPPSQILFPAVQGRLHSQPHEPCARFPTIGALRPCSRRSSCFSPRSPFLP